MLLTGDNCSFDWLKKYAHFKSTSLVANHAVLKERKDAVRYCLKKKNTG